HAAPGPHAGFHVAKGARAALWRHRSIASPDLPMLAGDGAASIRQRSNEAPQNLLTLSESRRSEAALSPTSRASFRKIAWWGRPGRGQMLFRVGRTLAVVVCVGAGAIEFAAAADIPYVQNPAPAYMPPTPSWAGFYLGGQVGYGADSVGWRNLGGSA